MLKIHIPIHSSKDALSLNAFKFSACAAWNVPAIYSMWSKTLLRDVLFIDLCKELKHDSVSELPKYRFEDVKIPLGIF